MAGTAARLMTPWLDPVAVGTDVQVRTAHGDWIAAAPDSRIEGTHPGGRRIHDFPVAWVRVAGARLPWPGTRCPKSRTVNGGPAERRVKQVR